MDLSSLGGGLVAFAFWGFLAAVVVGGQWYAIREKEMKQETLRQIVRSGQPIEQETIDRILGDDANNNVERDLRIGGIVCFMTSPGLFIFALFLRMVDVKAFYALTGVAGLVLCVAIGLLLAARYVARRNQSEVS
jgi:hypothetical protein